MLSYDLCVKNITMLAEIYEKQLTKPFVNIYYEVLKEMTDEDFKDAIRQLLSERVYPSFPKPAEILSLRKQVVVGGDDEITKEAKRLIDLTRAMNESVYQEYIRTGIPFNDLLDRAKFTGVSQNDIAILDKVKPHYSHKLLVGRINHFQTTLEAISVFKKAILSKNNFAIENKAFNQLEIKK